MTKTIRKQDKVVVELTIDQAEWLKQVMDDKIYNLKYYLNTTLVQHKLWRKSEDVESDEVKATSKLEFAKRIYSKLNVEL